MRRIIVIGCPGSGKSTFSRRLHQLTSIPLIHLDNLYWNSDGKSIGHDAFMKRLSAAMQEDQWILDGNYSSSMEYRLKRADTVFFLDYPTDTCLAGIRERRGEKRDDIPWIEVEEDPEFMEMIESFREVQRPRIMRLLDSYDGEIHVFKDREEADEYLQKKEKGNMRTLFIDACVRNESRTRKIAEHLLRRLGAEYETLKLSEVSFPEVDEDFLKKRDALTETQSFGNDLFTHARQFAEADTVVIAAPYYDLSFPAKLKQYLEQINVTGVTFYYTPEGYPETLCKAKRLYYVTTAGGPILSDEYGFGYVRTLAQAFYHIPEVSQIRAENLDIFGADVEAILEKAMSDVDVLEVEL